MKKQAKLTLAKKLTAFLMAAAMLTALAACGKTSETSFTVDKVVMTYVASPLNVPSIIEKDRGDFAAAFEKLGLGFGYSDLDSGADQTAALASGDIQILNAVGSSSVILAAANGADIVILSMYSAAPEAFAMFANDASLNSPEALRGKTIAGPKGTNLHELLAAYLATGNMTVDDVNFVSMDIPSSVAALESGSVDVALAGGAAAYNCEKSAKYKIADGEGLIPATIVTATTRKFADENPKIIETFLATQKQIVDYMLQNEDEALATAAESLGLEEEAVKEMYAMYDFDTSITDDDIAAIQATEAFLLDSGMVENHVDINDIIY